MVQSNKYYKSRVVGVTSKVGLTTDRDQETQRLLFFQDTGSHVVPATIQQYLKTWFLTSKYLHYYYQ